MHLIAPEALAGLDGIAFDVATASGNLALAQRTFNCIIAGLDPAIQVRLRVELGYADQVRV